MKKLLVLLLALAAVLSFAGCSKDGADASADETADETTEAEGSSAAVQTKYYGEVIKGIDENGKKYAVIRTDNWSDIDEKDVDDAFLAGMDSEWAEICEDLDFVRLELGDGETYSKSSTGFGVADYTNYKLKTPFGTYTITPLFQGGFLPETGRKSVVFKKPTRVASYEEWLPFEKQSSVVKYIRLIYGLKPAAEDAFTADFGSGMSVPGPVIKCGEKWIGLHFDSLGFDDNDFSLEVIKMYQAMIFHSDLYSANTNLNVSY